MTHQAATVALAAGLLLATTLLAGPPPTAAFLSSGSIAGLFLHRDGATTALAFSPPENEATASVPAVAATSPGDPAPAICARVPAPVNGNPQQAPTCSSATLGSLFAPAPFRVEGRGVLELWLSTNAPRMPILGFAARLVDVNATGGQTSLFAFTYQSGSGASTLAPAARNPDAALASADGPILLLDATPRKVGLGAARSGAFDVASGDTLRLVLDVVYTPVNAPGKADVLANFGAGLPSGILFQVSGGQAWQVSLGTHTLGVYPDQTKVRFDAPTNVNDTLRAFQPAATAVGPSQPSLSSPAKLAWGPTPLDEATNAVGDAIADVWLKYNPGSPAADPSVSVEVVLGVGGKTYTGATPVFVATGQAAGISRILVPLPTRGLVLTQGTPISLFVQLYAANASMFQVAYGSSTHPTGILIPVLGGGVVPPPSPSPSADNATQTPEPVGTNATATPSETPATPSTTSTSAPPTTSAAATTPVSEEAVAKTQEVGSGRSPGLGPIALFAAVGALALACRRGKGS